MTPSADRAWSWGTLGVVLAALVLGAGLAGGAPAVGLAVLVSAAASAAARAQERIAGSVAALWIALFVAASGIGGAVLTTRPEATLLAATASAMALVFRQQLPARDQLKDVFDIDDSEPFSRFALRWGGIGALLALAVIDRPVHLALLAAVGLAIPTERRRVGWTALTIGAVVGAATGWTLGIAEAPVAPATATESLQLGLLYPIENPPFFLQTLLHLGVGGQIGLLVVFPAVLLTIAGFEGGRLRWGLLLAVILVVVWPVVTSPFDIWGGGALAVQGVAGGPFANLWFLPVYPVLWFLPSRHARARWVGAVALLAVLFLVPQWLANWVRPISPAVELSMARLLDNPFSRFAQHWLPAETGQRFVQPSGLADRRHAGMWFRRLDRSAVVSDSVLEVRADEVAGFLIGTESPIESLIVRVGETAPSSIALDRAEVTQLMLSPDGSVAFEIELEKPFASHPTWWSADPVLFYRMSLSLPRAGPESGVEYNLRFRSGRLMESSR